MSEPKLTHEPGLPPVEELIDLARQGEWNKLEETWLQAVSVPDYWIDRPQYDKLFSLVKTRKSPSTVTALLELMLDALADEPNADPKNLLRIFARGYSHGPASGSMRQSLAVLCGRILDAEVAPRVVAFTGLEDESVTAKQAVDDFLLHYRLVPRAVFHHQYYGVGLVTSVDYDAQRVAMDFPDTTYRDIPVKFEHLQELLKPVPPDHFDELRLSRPDEVRRLADEEPGKLVRLIAGARQGEVKQSDIKTTLTTGVFTDAEFKTWWGKRRADIVRDPMLDVTGAGASCVFKMRESPKAYYEEQIKEFNEAKGFKAQFDAVRGIARAARDGAFPAEAWPKIVGPFQAAAIGRDKLAPYEKVGWEMLKRELAKYAPAEFKNPYSADIVALLRESPRPVDLMMRLEQNELLPILMPLLKEAYPKEWNEHYKRLAEVVPPRFIQGILDDLLATGQVGVAADVLGRLISFPERNPEGYLWAVSGLLDGSLSKISVGLDAPHLIDDLLNEIESLENAPVAVSAQEERDRKLLLQKIVKYVGDRHFKVVADVYESAPLEEASAFYQGLSKRRLSTDFVEALRAALRRTRNELEDASQTAAAAATAKTLGGGALLCTAKAIAAKRDEYRRINEVEIPANSKAIGAAAELGDLRENAEYHSAKDQQKILFRRVEELSMQLGRARVVEPDEITTKEIGFGVRAIVTDVADGSQRVYTILGPWESNPAEGIISYQSPLGQGFVGRKVGDHFHVKLPDGTSHEFIVKSLESAL